MGNQDHWNYGVFWKEGMNHIRERISEQEWIMWFSNIEYISSRENLVVVSVPSSFYRDQVKQRYLKLIETTIFELSGHKLTVEFSIKSRPSKGNGRLKEKSPSTISESSSSLGKEKNKDLSRPSKESDKSKLFKKTRQESSYSLWRKKSGLKEDYNFSQYVIGENNSLAVNAAYAISRNPGTAYNPYLIYGGVGLGKTHLIQAIGNSSYERDNSLNVVYVTAETFTDEFIRAIKDEKNYIFKNKYRTVDVLLIDDIHFLQGKDATQEELFHTFNALYNSNKQMVFTCDRPVSELKQLKDRLKNRFERGLNVDLQPPNFETRLAILKQKVEQKNTLISNEVLELICKNITTNVRDIEAALLRLIAYAELVDKEVTLDIAQKQLKDTFYTQKYGNISVENVQKVVSDYFNISTSDMKGKRRNKAIVLPRQIAMYIIRDLTEYSTTEIGLEFGGRDHTTVMHSCQRIESRIKTDSTLEPIIKNLIRIIKEQE